MRLRYFIALLAMSVSTAFGAQTADITFTSCKWDAAKQKIVTEQVTKSSTGIEGQNDEWQALGEQGKTTYYHVRGEVKRKRLVCYGEVHIVLCDNATLTLTSGIRVASDNQATLHIHSQSYGDSQGRLVAGSLYQGAAAIGSGEDELAGAIHIHGGVVEATGVKYAAGIGGGMADRNSATGSSFVYIYGGKVTARGGDSGAGIGGGANEYGHNCTSASGEVYIFGGEVSATGGEYAAGVGGGGGSEAFSPNKWIPGASGAAVYVYGGKLKAQGGFRAAGIGSGNDHGSSELHGGSLHVYGGTIDAIGGEYGAGIGGGCNVHGGTVEIYAGTVRASGGKNSAGIGGGEDGTSGTCNIHGGKVTAIIGPNCAGREAGKGSAIGSGKGEDKNHYRDDALKIADNMMVRAGDGEANIERTFTTPERVKACQWRNVAIIEACTHEGATYVIIDGEKHRRNCTYCADNKDELHDFGQAGNRHDCACGQKFDSETTVLTLTRYYLTYDGSQPAIGSVTEKVARGKGYVLPAPPAINGLIFKGYSTTATAAGEMLDSEEGTLIAAGEVSLTDNAAYYARYRYDFQPEWTWNDECTEASVKITNDLLNGSETLTATCQLVENQQPAGNQWGRMTYKATATYNRKTGITYTFTDEQVQEYYNLTEITLDAYDDNNETIVEQYKDRNVVATIQNLTLKKDGKLHSLCLPFAAKINESPLEGATIYSATGETIVDGQLQMTFQPVSGEWIAAGEPYFVKWPQGTDIENPTFSDVYVGDGCWSVADQYYELGGTFDEMAFDDDDKVFALEDSELKPLDYNIAPAFSNYLFIPFEKTAEGDVAVTSVRLIFEGDITVEAALYDEWEGEGTAESPYLILTPQQLQKMSAAFKANDDNVRGKYFRQEANITFDKTQENNFTPVNSFNGHYDGDGHVIRGLNINQTGSNNAALFLVMEDGSTVKNLIVKNSAFTGSSAAPIAGSLNGTASVENCHVLKDVSVTANNYYAAGVVANMQTGTPSLKGCSSQATVTANQSDAAGIVGIVNCGTVSDCLYLGTSITASSSSSNAHAVAVANYGAMSGCYFTAPMLSDTNGKLMPQDTEDNNDFINNLSALDQYLTSDKTNLTVADICYDLALNNRTLYKDGSWNTLCLPFSLENLDGTPLAEATVKTLTSSDYDTATGTLTLTFSDAVTAIEAGKPYIVKWTKPNDYAGRESDYDITAPVFNGVTIDGIMGGTAGTMYIDMKGSCTPVTLAGGDKSVLYLGADNKLHYPSTALTVGSCRAYFQLNNGLTAGDLPTHARAFVLNFSDGETTSIKEITDLNPSPVPAWEGGGAWYSIDGRRLSGKPAASGLYICNGKKVKK